MTSAANLSTIRLGGDVRDRRITADDVADALREAIHSGGLADGAVLNQAAIASHNEALRGERNDARWLQGNERFHHTLYEPSGAEATLELLEQLRARAERDTQLRSRGSGIHRPDEASAEHEAILMFVEAGDGLGARAAVERHIHHTRDRVVTYGETVVAAEEARS